MAEVIQARAGNDGILLCEFDGRVLDMESLVAPLAARRHAVGLTGHAREAAGVALADLPSGTVTFLFTDLEGSTRLWEEHPEAMSRLSCATTRSCAMRSAARRPCREDHGDGFTRCSPSRRMRSIAAVAAQLVLAWRRGVPGAAESAWVCTRCDAEVRDGDYYGTR